MTKVLIDCVHTNDPQFCSANYKMQQLMKYVLSHRDDVFFYYLLPVNKKVGYGSWETDKNWLMQHKNIKYIDIATSADRMREYWSFSQEMEKLVAFNGDIWDFDIILTGRHSMVPMFKAWMGRSGGARSKKVFIEDEFPVMTFKKRACMPFGKEQDMYALDCYWQADRTYMLSFYSKSKIMNRARDFFAPSIVRELEKKIVTTSSVQVKDFHLKDDAYIKKVTSKKKRFTVAFPIRARNVNKYIPTLAMFERNWIKNGKEDVRYLCCQNSRHVEKIGTKYKYMETIRANREEFWRLMREEVDLISSYCSDADYPLSIIEPLYLGVPAIILRAEYTDATFGKDYPFYVNNEKEGYAIFKAFRKDYAGMYKKFREWYESYWISTLNQRNDLWLPILFLKDIEAAENDNHTRYKDKKENNQIVQLILDEVKGKKSFVLHEVFESLEKQKKLGSLAQIYKKDRRKIPLAMATEYNAYRLYLIHAHGFKDASTKTGHFTR